MPITHKFTSAKQDQGDNSLVQPSNWNDNHNFVPWVIPLVNASVTWTNMPTNATEFTGNSRTKVDLTYAEEARLVACMGVAGSANARLEAQYSLNQSSWFQLTESIGIAGTDVFSSSWTSLPSGANEDIFVRIMGSGGNGNADPQIRLVQLQVR